MNKLISFFKQYFFVILGPFLFLTIYSLPNPEHIPVFAWHLIASLAWILLWWSTEAIPIPATSLLPILIFPALEILPLKAVLANYSKPIIFTFMGGFFIAASLEKWNLHRRFAISVLDFSLKCFGQNTQGLIAGFMIATALLSMWISNTATTIMMMAIAMSVIEFLSHANLESKQNQALNKALMLSIAYSASIGGIGTLIGTPPNLFFAQYLEESTGKVIDMYTWMKLAIPIVLTLLPIAWIWLTKFKFKIYNQKFSNLLDLIQKEKQNFSPLTPPEWAVFFIFILTASLWIFKQPINNTFNLSLSDSSIAIFSAVLLFCFPASTQKKQFLLNWETAQNIPWGILLMFGGGLSVASGFSATGLTDVLAAGFAILESVPPLVFLIFIVAFTLLLTELVTNSAAIATILPITTAICLSLGFDFLYLAIPITISCSAAFMFPISTPPNAIVFAYKDLQIKDMIGAGFVLNILAILVLVVLTSLFKYFNLLPNI